MTQIFLSYTRLDEDKVEDLYQKLSDAGFKPWMDKKDILPGEMWENSIQRAIRRSDFFLACLSANSVNRRGFLQREIKDALNIWQEMLEDDIYLIPVRVEDCEVPASLRKFQWVNLFEADGWTRLVKAIQVGMRRRREVPADEEQSIGTKIAVPEEGPEQVLWNHLLDLAKQQTSRYLGYVQSPTGGKKYIPAIYRSRRSVEEDIDNFLSNDRTGLILIGDSGVGKTNLLCHLTEQLLKDGNVVLLYGCAGSLSLDIETEIRRDLFISEDVLCLSALEKVSQEAVREGKCFVVLFDAINEFRYENATRTADLLKNIDSLIGRCRYPKIKFILSCRTSTWNHLDLLGYTELNWRAYYPSGDERVLILERFTAEEFDQVYPLYREAFSLKSELSALSDRTKKRCQDPLLLRMTAEVYQANEGLISKDAPAVTVFKDYYETKVRKPPALDEMFLEDLAIEMERNKTDSLPVWYLQRNENLGKHVTEDLDCAYQRLKGVGVLMEIPGGEFEGCLVKFTYDRVFEYILARYFLRQEKLSVKTKSIEEMVREARDYPSLWGTTKMMLLLREDEQEFLRLAQSVEYETRELVVESLVALYADEPKKARGVLQHLITYRSGQESVEAEPAAGEAGLELPLRTALKATRMIRRGISEVFLEAAASRTALQRDIAANELYILWQQESELGFKILREIIGSIRPQLSSRPLQLLDFAARFSFGLFANNCHRSEIIQQLSDIWWYEFEERFKIQDWFGVSVAQRVMDICIRKAARRGIADAAVNTITLDGAISPERFFKGEAETKKIKESVGRLVEYLDPSTDVIQALPDVKTLLSSDLLYPKSLAPLILTVHAFEDFERIGEVLEQLFEELPGTGRLWLLLTFALLAPMKQVSADALVKLVACLTSRILQENRDDFFKGPRGIFEKEFDIGFLPLGLTYGKLGLEMEYLSEIIRRSRLFNDLELLERCVRGLASIGLYYPEASLGLLDQALTGQIDQIDQPELRELRKTTVQTLATIGVIYNDKVGHFLLKMDIDESFRRDVQVREDASLVKRYVDAIGLYNVSAYGCRFYPRIRKMVQSGYQAVTECKDLTELVSRIAQSYIRLVLDSNYRISEMISQL